MGNRALKLMSQTKLNTDKFSESNVSKKKKVQAVSPVRGRERNGNSCNRNSLISQALFCCDLISYCITAPCWGCRICRKTWISFGKQYEILSPSPFPSCLGWRETRFLLWPNSSMWTQTAASATERELAWTRQVWMHWKGWLGAEKIPSWSSSAPFQSWRGQDKAMWDALFEGLVVGFPAQMPLFLFPPPSEIKQGQKEEGEKV